MKRKEKFQISRKEKLHCLLAAFFTMFIVFLVDLVSGSHLDAGGIAGYIIGFSVMYFGWYWITGTYERS